MTQLNYIETINLLRNDTLTNIVLLKHAAMLKENAEYKQIEELIGIKFQASQTSHDRADYSNYDSIHILSNNNPENIATYLESLSYGCHIFKINGHVANKEFELLRSFKSLTTQNCILITITHNIIHENNIETNEYEKLFKLIHYSIHDIKYMINNHSAIIFSIKDRNIPVVSCMVYQVFDNVWEIGALSTLVEYRRNHFAEELVSCATNYILEKKLTPRYHVFSENIASLKLAEKCGYKPFLDFNHYKYVK
ncbi:MAG: hypothetical protein A2015_11115 [Spirochaetes bacterium GWF1_31_7]|nr:MAG: hypothetical protein A2Y30_02350 [Spirochaetes bacterium GWE1_32_154]OHD46374.1 MAG: hypothetical protein A2Y29_04210 [Spirochaetes bacterium GWE2_31_10]OHD47753.1 MAG: hypothetical protein A2015_11115 [Spirochaetes bacterium GWF1_31_7]